MIKINKIIIVICIFNLLGCGYQPIFYNSDFNFSIENIEQTGSRKVNSILIDKIRNIKKGKSLTYDLKLSSILEKKTISKDKSGDPSKFEISIITSFEVFNSKNNRVLFREISRKLNYDNKSDNFELSRYEDLVTENLSTTIAEEIFSLLANLNSL